MQTSDAGLALIKRSEGFVGHIYKDQAGLDTIGYGHLLTAEDKASGRFLGGLDEAGATDLLRRDVGSAESAVNSLVSVNLSQNQFDALVDFVFNLGRGALAISTLLRLLNEGEYGQVPAQFLVWDKVRDPTTHQLVVNQGLLERRQREAALWQQG